MTEVFVIPECPFSLKSFDLLAQLKKNSSKKDFYLKYKEDFQNYIEWPIQKLLEFVLAQLKGEIIKQLDTKVDLSSSLYHPYFEYNLSSKNLEKKFNNARFFIRIVQDWFWFGLYISETSTERQRFIKNVQNNINIKEILLQHTKISNNCSLFSESSQEITKINRLADWLKIVSRQKSATKCIQISRHIRKEEVLNFDYQQLTNEIKQLIEGIYLLLLN
ncbi:MAG: hypothetical protein V7L05_18800 [Nostoc sp.]|uniref:hypothetical protein n=1 Tax=Nostoc sp. TaxID=1180 RepID=UPI002FF892C4